MNFMVPADHRVKTERKRKDKQMSRTLPENEKKNNNLKLWNMRVMGISTGVVARRMVLKGLEEERRNWKLEEESKPSRPRHC